MNNQTKQENLKVSSFRIFADQEEYLEKLGPKKKSHFVRKAIEAAIMKEQDKAIL